MQYGMTYDQFWFGDPWMVRAYAQSYLLKRRVENENMWIQGIYVANALQMVIGNAFGKNSHLKYFEKPLEFFPKTESEKKQEVREERQKLIHWLNQWKQSANMKQGVDEHGEPGNT